MVKKISKAAAAEIETFFAHAVALEQRGRGKNMILLNGSDALIMNYDKTVILHRELERFSFDDEMVLFASDYDSSDFEIQGERVVFKTSSDNFTRKKFCKVPGVSFSDVMEAFKKGDSLRAGDLPSLTFDSTDLSLLDSGLSHVEFLSREGKPVIIQRDIFSGSIIELTPRKKGFGAKEVKSGFDIEKIGMRTQDLDALLSFGGKATIIFPGNIMIATLPSFKAVIGGCLYDELGNISYLEGEDHGRQIEEGRRSKQDTGGSISEEEERRLRRRRRKLRQERKG
jgi:hypothetical protein